MVEPERKRECPGCSQVIPTWRMTCPMCGERVYRALVERERKAGEVPNPEKKSKPFIYQNELARALRKGNLVEFMKKRRIRARKLEELTGIAYGQWRLWATEGEKVRDSQILEILSALDAG